MAEIHDLVKQGITLSKKIKKIPFSDLVKATTEFEIYPLNLQDEKDLALFNEIETSAINYIKYITRIHQRYEGKRINEVGRRI